jgi:hypothetical protein
MWWCKRTANKSGEGPSAYPFSGSFRFVNVLSFYFVLGLSTSLLHKGSRGAIGTAARFYWNSGPVYWNSGPVYGTAARSYPQAKVYYR